jgi:DUF1680 family protein
VHNALLAGVGDDGCSWFYSSPLSATHGDEANPWHYGDFAASSVLERFPARRLPWYDVTCCPTNLTRWLGALPDWHGAAEDPVADALDTPAQVVQGHPRNEAARGCVAVELGPFVLCAEEADLPGLRGGDIALHEVGNATVNADGLPTVDAVVQPIGWDGPAFGGHEHRGELRHTSLRPFHSWGNRGVGAMTVWFRR